MAKAKRLFVPLMTEYFEDFLHNGKRYELRRNAGPWTEKNVYEGRPVMIGKGYSGPRAYGVVGEVVVGKLEDILRKTGHRAILPRVGTRKEAIMHIDEFFEGCRQYIAFEVLLNRKYLKK